VLELFARKEIALGGFAGGIADHAGGATGERERMMAGKLKTAQRELAHEVTDVERIAGGVEAAIQRDGALSEALGERFFVGAVGDEAAPLEVFEEIHGRVRKTNQGGQGKGGAEAETELNLMGNLGKQEKSFGGLIPFPIS
jgi:hypothetical protein